MRLALFILFAAVPAMADGPYSWQTCVELATTNNAELRSAHANAQSVESLEGAAFSNFLPALGASMNATQGNSSANSNSSSATFFGSTSTSTTTYSASLTATQNLFNGFQDQAKVKQAKSNTRAAEANLQTARAKVSYELKASYQGLLYAKDYTKLTKDIIKRREDNLRLVELRYQGGRENRGSVLLSKAYLNQSQYDDLQAKNSVGVARAQLSRAIGIDDNETVDIFEEIPVHDPPENVDFRQLASSTPDHLQAVAQEDAADAAITNARSSYFPTLNLTGTAGRQGSAFFPQGERWSVGVTLAIPLFNGLRDYYSTKAASLSYFSSSSNRLNVDRQMLARLKQAYSAYVEAVAKFKVDESFRDAASVRAEIARNKYNNGLLSFEDWDVIESDLIARQKNYVQSKRDRVIAEAAWEQAQGKGAVL